MGNLSEAPEDFRPTTSAAVRLGKLNALLERSGIDVDDFARVERVNIHQMGYVDKAGEAQTLDLGSLTLIPHGWDGPSWPVVQPGPAVRLPKRESKPANRDGWLLASVIPDMQVGFFRNVAGELEPTHDEAAIAVTLAMLRAARPSVVVLVGDNADLPELSKYRLTPPYAQTTQATIDRLTLLIAQIRDAIGPGCLIVWLAGNHEERLPNYLLDNARAAFGLRQGVTPDSWPVLSMPHLCRMDDYGVEYRPGYPASDFWINERVRVIHGDRVKSKGSTAHVYLADEKTSVIYGHVHRREWAEVTRQDHDGPRTIMAASPGCLARLDGAVPSTKQGTDLDGRPLVRAENWQQGVAFVEYEPGDGRFVYEQVPIRDGWGMWRGKHYTAPTEPTETRSGP